MALHRRLWAFRTWGASVLFLCGAIPGSPVGHSVVSGDHFQLTDDSVAQFRRQGYLRLQGFASQDEVALMRNTMGKMIDAWELPAEGSDAMAAFRASLSLRSGGDDGEKDHSFFLDSATKASVFVEPGAVDLTSGTLRPGVDKRLVVRKVAHGLHLVPGPFRNFSTSPKVAAVVTALGHRKPVVAQALYRLVPPLAAGVDRHQDSTMLYTEPPTCLGLWLALEDTTKTNGCLRVREGSHREPIHERLLRRPGMDGKSVQIIFEKTSNESRSVPPDSDFTALEVSSGDLLVMHGSLEHASFAGTVPNKSRESFQLHVVDGEARWSPENWLQYPPSMSFTPLAPPASSKLEL